MIGNDTERAAKHYPSYRATQGCDFSKRADMRAFFNAGLVRKEDLAATFLRAHQAVVDATKSPQREFAGQKIWLSLTSYQQID